jgi:hypothetical protein
MNFKEINLEILTKQYRFQSKGDKGYELITDLLESADVQSLDTILRNHILEPIELPSEIEARENVDSLLDYYSLLQIALFANYIDYPLSEKLTNEIDLILDTISVRKYYENYYPLLLPQLLLKQIQKNEHYKNNINIESTILFDRFLILNQFVKNDEDIQLLLWFFDDGWIGKYSIRDFLNLLQHKTKMIDEYSNRTHPLNKVMWGFTKYTQFLSDYAELIRDCNTNPILQSALWHFHSYWFSRIENKISQNLKISIQSIKESFLHFNSKELIYDQHSYLTSIEEIKDWKLNANHLDTVEKDIEYLFNIELGQPLYDLNNALNSN